MKKLLQLGTLFVGILVAQSAYSENYPQGQNFGYGAQQGQNFGYNAQQGQNFAGQDGPCEDQRLDDCWCLYVHYEPCYYTTKRCVEEKIPCKKRCCRYVDQYYEVDRCRYVPQYYKETKCRKVPEYYEVDDCKVCKKEVCDTHCKYVPKYYWKHVCGSEASNIGGGCATGSCSR